MNVFALDDKISNQLEFILNTYSTGTLLKKKNPQNKVC